MTIEKINIDDINNIENISNKINIKKSTLVGRKFSTGIFFGIIGILFVGIIGFFGPDNIFQNLGNISGVGANILDSENLKNIEFLHGSAEKLLSEKNTILKNTNYLNNFYLFLLILFFAIYTLYIFAKMELQKFGEQNGDQKDFVTRNFPSIYILETMTMLYVISFTVLSFYLIQQINFEIAFKTINSSLQSVANFALFGGSLSSLFYFLHKVRPSKFENLNNENSKDGDIKIDFDINRVLKYLSFPFMSAGMGVISYLIIMGIGDILGIEVFKNPSEYFIILLATMAGYFCDAFVIFFHSIFKSIESILNKKIRK